MTTKLGNFFPISIVKSLYLEPQTDRNSRYPRYLRNSSNLKSKLLLALHTNLLTHKFFYTFLYYYHYHYFLTYLLYTLYFSHKFYQTKTLKTLYLGLTLEQKKYRASSTFLFTSYLFNHLLIEGDAHF